MRTDTCMLPSPRIRSRSRSLSALISDARGVVEGEQRHPAWAMLQRHHDMLWQRGHLRF